MCIRRNGQLFEVSELVTILGTSFFRDSFQELFVASASAGKEIFSLLHTRNSSGAHIDLYPVVTRL
jgi:hypothetical protein